MSTRGQTLSNMLVSLSVDARGQIVRLRNRATGAELIGRPGAAEAWRIVAPAGWHALAFLRGSEQTPARTERIENTDGPSLRNATRRAVSVRAGSRGADRTKAWRHWRQFRPERCVRSLPATVRLKAWEAAVLLACRSERHRQKRGIP